MSFDDISIRVANLSKCYNIYDKPQDRLLQSIVPRFQRLSGNPPKQYFHEFWALRDVSFEIKQGETVGVIGRNGSGKSTLLQLICGTLNPTSGSVQTNGRIAALLELGSGFNPEFTGRENVFLNASILGMSNDEMESRYDAIAAFADIGEFIDQPVKTYSSGMAVRLAFSVAINADPQILVVDEALSVGDELFQRKCFSRIEKLKNDGATILFVSHAGGTIVELCDHAVLMDTGEKLAMGVPKTIVGLYQKLLYAPVEAQREIREAIQTSHVENDSHKYLAKVPVSPNALSELEKSDDHHTEFFDSNLKPANTLFYESNGARIRNPEIYTLDGKKVNWLKSGTRYNYVYSVQFEKDSHDVRFGMMIKALNGTELGGIGSAPLGYGIEYINAGTVVNVCFTFQCSLLPGHYFVNAGCSGKLGGADTFLHRIVDAVTFRVFPMSRREVRAGYIDIAADDCYCTIELKT